MFVCLGFWFLSALPVFVWVTMHGEVGRQVALFLLVVFDCVGVNVFHRTVAQDKHRSCVGKDICSVTAQYCIGTEQRKGKCFVGCWVWGEC